MPTHVEQTVSVFISYRREGGFYLAKCIYDHLKAQKYDVFMDVHTLGAGDFEHITLAEIAARDYFVIVLTVGSLERMLNDDDWLRRELAAALRAERTIVPVLDVRFDFAAEDVQRALRSLPPELRKITTFNAVRMPPYEYFDNGLARLLTFLVAKRDTRRRSAGASPPELARAAAKLHEFSLLPAIGGADPFRLAAPTLTVRPFRCSWTEVLGATGYVLQRSVDRTFKSATVAYEGTDTSRMDLTLAEGSTFYRVKAVSDRGAWRDSSWSDVHEAPPLVIPALTGATLAAPKLTGQFLGHGCSWTKVPGATGYVLESSTNSTFTPATVAYEGTDTSYVNVNLPSGSTFFRVKAVSDQGARRESKWSDVYERRTRFFRLPMPDLALAAPLLTRLPLGFGWTEVPGATKYLLQSSRNQNFTPAEVKYEGTGTSYIDYLHRAGFYRVKALGPFDTSRVSSWSNIVEEPPRPGRSPR